MSVRHPLHDTVMTDYITSTTTGEREPKQPRLNRISNEEVAVHMKELFGHITRLRNTGHYMDQSILTTIKTYIDYTNVNMAWPLPASHVKGFGIGKSTVLEYLCTNRIPSALYTPLPIPRAEVGLLQSTIFFILEAKARTDLRPDELTKFLIRLESMPSAVAIPIADVLIENGANPKAPNLRAMLTDGQVTTMPENAYDMFIRRKAEQQTPSARKHLNLVEYPEEEFKKYPMRFELPKKQSGKHEDIEYFRAQKFLPLPSSSPITYH